MYSHRTSQHLPQISNSSSYYSSHKSSKTRNSPHTTNNNNNSNSTRVGKYIQQSLLRIDHNCYSNTGKLNIDGSIGDYKMSIFRLKDRNKHINNIPTIFTNTFIGRMEKLSPSTKQQLHEIINAPNQKYQSNNNMPATDTNNNNNNNNNNILHRKNPQLPQLQTMEDEHLYYKYLPKYQRQKWFNNKTIGGRDSMDGENLDKQRLQSLKHMNSNSSKKKKIVINRDKQRTHFFRVLDKSYLQFGEKYQNRSNK